LNAIEGGVLVKIADGCKEMTMDITAISFGIRSRVYQAAEARAPANRKVVVTFGVGRL